MTRLQKNSSALNSELSQLLPKDQDEPPSDYKRFDDGIDSLDIDLESDELLLVPTKCAESVEKFAKYMWKTMSHHELPAWLKDNEYLHHGHRPALPSIHACIESCFRIHSETVNIWTHFIGGLIFIGIAIYTFTVSEKGMQEKLIHGAFFIGAVVCLFFSASYHTFCCYSISVSNIFRKLDYCGISVLTMGSFVPWLHYAFMCDIASKTFYLILIGVLGCTCIAVSLIDKFGEADYRATRAGMFIALGLSAVIPVSHYVSKIGFYRAYNVGNISWLVGMAVLYILGAVLYAVRIPERLFPGKFDIWFQSHQIFHVCVVAAAYVHYIGIERISNYRATLGDCLAFSNDADFSFEY